MKVHLSYAAGFYTKSFEDFLDFAAQCGVDGVQLIPDQHPNLYSDMPRQRVLRLREKLERSALTVSLHNVFYDINICSLVPEVHNFSIEVTEKVVKLCVDLGARELVVHPGYIYPGWKNDALQNERFWDAAETSIGDLVRICAACDVRLLLENGSYTLSSRTSLVKHDFHLGISPKELGRLLGFAGGYGRICFDVGKARASNIPPKEFFDAFGSSIVQAQISSFADFIELERLVSSDQGDALVVVFEGRSNEELELILERTGRR